ncbi:MAG: glycosyltransferase family 87 protein [Planctomycetales bacterium]
MSQQHNRTAVEESSAPRGRWFQFSLNRPRDEFLGWCLWLGMFVVLAVFFLPGNHRSVTVQYHRAADYWMQGKDIYFLTGRGFLYLPLAAVLFIPLHLLSPDAGELVWRVLTLGVFAAGVLRLCRLAEFRIPDRLFLIVTGVSIPLCCSAARNGQSTLIMAGLMMLAMEQLTRKNWNATAVLLCLATAFKPLSLVLLLLLAALYRPLLWRLALGVCLLLLAPFLTQSPEYVVRQYSGCLEMLRAATKLGIEQPWAQLFGMLQIGGVSLPAPVQTGLRMIAALLTLFLAQAVRRAMPATRAAVYLYALAGCYLMLFNPRSENNTYALVAPVLGIFCAEEFLIRKAHGRGALLALLALGTVGSFEFGSFLLPDAEPVWLAPLMCLAFTGYLLTRMRAEACDWRTLGATDVETPAPLARAA